MQSNPLRNSVIGSYPFPGWLDLASENLANFGANDLAEVQRDAVIAAVHDQLAAGLDVITDGEQTRFDFNLSFYGYIRGIELESASPRLFGPPAHDQRGKHAISGELHAPDGLGAVEEYERLVEVYQAAYPGRPVTLKASVPGPYTMSGRLLPNAQYPDRWAITEALLPIVRRELKALVAPVLFAHRQRDVRDAAVDVNVLNDMCVHDVLVAAWRSHTHERVDYFALEREIVFHL